MTLKLGIEVRGGSSPHGGSGSHVGRHVSSSWSCHPVRVKLCADSPLFSKTNPARLLFYPQARSSEDLQEITVFHCSLNLTLTLLQLCEPPFVPKKRCVRLQLLTHHRIFQALTEQLHLQTCFSNLPQRPMHSTSLYLHICNSRNDFVFMFWYLEIFCCLRFSFWKKKV